MTLLRQGFGGQARPLVAMPAGAAGPLDARASADGLESFDLIVHGDPAEAIALARQDAVGALVLVSCPPPAAMEPLQLPALVLVGTRDAALAPETARRWRALIPGCNLVYVYDAGADIAADRPEAFAEIVQDFLADPGAFLVNRQSGALNP